MIPHKTFYFIRHGETDWNKDRIIMGHTDIPLNQNGILQAYSAQKFFKDLTFDRIYASPLKRAYQTVEILNEHLKSSLVTDDDLMERGFGKYEGGPHNPSSLLLKSSELPEGAESIEEVDERVLRAMQKILSESKSTPLIVSHGGVFVALARHCAANPDLRAANCQLFLFKAPDDPLGKWTICDVRDADLDKIYQDKNIQ
ncbi:MAG: histidine phosphatase family protein [Pseudomonadota bacterium]